MKKQIWHDQQGNEIETTSPGRDRVATTHTKEWFEDLYITKGLTYAEIADKASCSKETVRRRIERYGFPHRIAVCQPSVENVCPGCKKLVKATHSSVVNGRGIYCSTKCQYEARRNRVDRTCKHCKKKFRVKASRVDHGRGLYCSTKCRILSGYGGAGTYGKGVWFAPDNSDILWLRSSYEVRVVEALDNTDIAWRYEPVAFPLDGTKPTTYRPDIYLKEYGVYWEVKGWMRPDAQEKLEKFSEQYPSECLRILYEDDLIEFEQAVASSEEVDPTLFGTDVAEVVGIIA